MLSVKQGGIKYHFLSLWYDSTWVWTQVSQTIGKHYSLGQNPDILLCKLIFYYINHPSTTIDLWIKMLISLKFLWRIFLNVYKTGLFLLFSFWSCIESCWNIKVYSTFLFGRNIVRVRTLPNSWKRFVMKPTCHRRVFCRLNAWDLWSNFWGPRFNQIKIQNEILLGIEKEKFPRYLRFYYDY